MRIGLLVLVFTLLPWTPALACEPQVDSQGNLVLPPAAANPDMVIEGIITDVNDKVALIKTEIATKGAKPNDVFQIKIDHSTCGVEFRKDTRWSYAGAKIEPGTTKPNMLDGFYAYWGRARDPVKPDAK